MAAHAPKLQVLAVEEKAFLRVYPEGTQAQGLLDGIRLLPVHPQADFCPIAEGVAPPVPQARIFQGKGHFLQALFACRQGAFPATAPHFPLPVQKAEAHKSLLHLAAAIRETHQRTPRSVCPADAVLHEAHAARSIVRQRHAHRLGHDEVHVAVNPAVEIEIPRQGHHVQRLAVAHEHCHHVLSPVAHPAGNLKDERPVTAPVLPHVTAVHKNVRHAIRPLEAQEKPLPTPFLAHH